jgi:hypothetical protein
MRLPLKSDAAGQWVRGLCAGLLLAFCAVQGVGCSSVSVRKSEFSGTSRGGQLPKQIFVRPFVVEAQVLRVDRSGEELASFQKNLSLSTAEQLSERLTKYVAPTTLISADEKPPGGPGWLIEGRFDRVNQGSRFLRAVLGWGLGGTKMECTAQVYELWGRKSPQLYAVISTTGGSNAEPGALLSGPMLAAPRLLLQASKNGVSTDARRTARMITAVLSEHLAAEGATLPRPALTPKRLGTLPSVGEPAR